MKSIYFFCTKPWIYLTELPILFMLRIALIFNSQSDEIFKFYPLIIALSAAIIFIFVYFFRAISISYDEIRYHGLFSSHDSATIEENKTLIISIKPKFKLGFELYGDVGKEPLFDWMKAEEAEHRDVCIFRGKAIGGKKSALRVLKFFGVPACDLSECTEDSCLYEDGNIKVNCERKNENLEISVKFKTTIV